MSFNAFWLHNTIIWIRNYIRSTYKLYTDNTDLTVCTPLCANLLAVLGLDTHTVTSSLSAPQQSIHFQSHAV